MARLKEFYREKVVPQLRSDLQLTNPMEIPKIVKALYVLFTIWTVLAALGILGFFINFGGLQGALAAIIIVDPVFVLLSLGIYRVILEAFMVVFQIHGELKTIREQGENRD